MYGLSFAGVRMKRIKVGSICGGYEILTGGGIINKAGELIRAEAPGALRAMIISDENVFDLYGKKLTDILCGAGFTVSSSVFGQGEADKNIASAENIIEDAAKNFITRSDVFVALGGGVTGDLGGFAASVYLRGVKLIQIPTTLLAMTDSSIGGKNGVNTKSGKNMIGTFYHPSCIICDTDFLKTLPQRQISCGIAEVIKYGLIHDSSIAESLSDEEYSLDAHFEEIVHKCCEIKKYYVEADAKDNNIRMILNFGHTFGHAFEKHGNYTGCNHGEAIAAGMNTAAMFGQYLGLTSPGTSEYTASLLKKYNLPVLCKTDPCELLDIIATDKKRSGEDINIILLSEVGKAFIKKFNFIEFKKIFSEFSKSMVFNIGK